MFSSNRSLESIQEIIVEIKRYIELQKKFVRLDFVSKMTILLSALLLGAILFLLGTIVILYVSLTVASILTDLCGSQVMSYSIVTLLFILLAVLVYVMRKRWITQPLTNFLANLFLNDNH